MEETSSSSFICGGSAPAGEGLMFVQLAALWGGTFGEGGWGFVEARRVNGYTAASCHRGHHLGSMTKRGPGAPRWGGLGVDGVRGEHPGSPLGRWLTDARERLSRGNRRRAQTLARTHCGSLTLTP